MAASRSRTRSPATAFDLAFDSSAEGLDHVAAAIAANNGTLDGWVMLPPGSADLPGYQDGLAAHGPQPRGRRNERGGPGLSRRGPSSLASMEAGAQAWRNLANQNFTTQNGRGGPWPAQPGHHGGGSDAESSPEPPSLTANRFQHGLGILAGRQLGTQARRDIDIAQVIRLSERIAVYLNRADDPAFAREEVTTWRDSNFAPLHFQGRSHRLGTPAGTGSSGSTNVGSFQGRSHRLGTLAGTGSGNLMVMTDWEDVDGNRFTVDDASNLMAAQRSLLIDVDDCGSGSD